MGTPQKSKCRVALVGYGYWGPNLLRNLLAHGDFEFVGLVEIGISARQKFSRLFPQFKIYTDLTTLFAEQKPEAVVIATPPATHRDLAIRCLSLGADILVEKPLALSVEHCKEILSAAEKYQRKVMVDHTFVYNPAVEYLTQSLKEGDLGDLLYYDSVRVNLGGFQSRTNVLWDLAPHDLSILDRLTNGMLPKTVSCVGVRHFDQTVENICYVHLNYANNIMAHLNFNWVAPIKIRTVIVAGTKKMAVYDENLSSEKIKVYDRGISVSRSNQNDIRAQYRVGDMTAPAIVADEALGVMIQAFFRYVTLGQLPLTDGYAGLRVVEVLEAAARSMEQNGAPVALHHQGSELPPLFNTARSELPLNS